MKKTLLLLFSALLHWFPAPSSAQFVSVNSDYVAVVGDQMTQSVVFGTSPLYSPPDADLSYDYDSLTNGLTNTTHTVFLIDGTPHDMDDISTPVGVAFHASGSGLGAFLEGSRLFGNVEGSVRYEIVSNVLDNALPDMFMIRFTVTNHDSAAHDAACRFELDTMVNGNDGTNISIDNGASVITVGQVWRQNAGPVPSDWWDFDVDPHLGPPQLVGRGVLDGNPYGDPATAPDCVEIENWGTVSTTGQWTVGGFGIPINSDSAIVFWWTGSGSEAGNGFSLGPGQAVTFTTYYGLNAGVLLATPTPNPSLTPTNSPTVTFTPTPTFTPTVTPTPTVTSSPTASFSPTVTASPTPSPTPTPTWEEVPNTFLISDNLTGPERPLRTAFCSDMAGNVHLRVYNSAGELVRIVWEGRIQRGEWYHPTWDLRNHRGDRVASGVYVIQLTMPSFSQVRRFLVL